MKLALTLRVSANAGIDMELVHEAERLGYEAVWCGEAYGTDAVAPVAWVLAQTQKIKAGTAIMQMSARTPASYLAWSKQVLNLLVSSPSVFARFLRSSGASFDWSANMASWYGQNLPCSAAQRPALAASSA